MFTCLCAQQIYGVDSIIKREFLNKMDKKLVKNNFNRIR